MKENLERNTKIYTNRKLQLEISTERARKQLEGKQGRNSENKQKIKKKEKEIEES